MRRWRKARLTLALVLSMLPGFLPGGAWAASRELIPVGCAIGIRLTVDGVEIVGLTEVAGADGSGSPALEAGLVQGDVVKGINGRQITDAADFVSAVSELDGSAVEIVVEREGKTVHFSVEPRKNVDGAYQLGLWLRDGVTGIGTMTYYDPHSGLYGALGHGINDDQSEELTDFDNGGICSAEIAEVIKGAQGSPGELCGSLGNKTIGSIEKNTLCGIYGALNEPAEGQALPVGDETDITLGDASILANVDGSEVKEYAIQISRVYRNSGESRTMMLTVTDPQLLAQTGGIVQGMSGSPILQNGKLIGAVTHVLISDPTRGYGVSIEKMLAAEQNAA